MMERSRKGTKLNDAQYFRQPLPHARKKMTKLRVLRTMSGKIAADNVVKHPIWMRYQSNSLNRDQPSTEITKISYKEQNKVNDLVESCTEDCQEIASTEIETLIEKTVNTEIIKKPEEINPRKIAAIATVKFENKPTIKRAVKREKVIRPPKETFFSEESENIKEEKPTTWWKIIVNFISIFLGKRESNNEKRSKKRWTNIDQRIHQEQKFNDLERSSKEQRRENHRHQLNESVKTRRISSPLY